MMFSRKVSVAVLALVFMVALVYATPVQAKDIIRWEYYDKMNVPIPEPPGHTLDGEIWGEDVNGNPVHGDFYWVNTGRFYAGETVHMYGYWGIDWGQDGSTDISGMHTGVWVLSNNRVNVRGTVTAASPGWTHLIGRNVHTVVTMDMTTLTISGIFQIN